MAFVRVKSPHGDEYTTDDSIVELTGVTVIDKPAVDASGRPLASKPNIHKGGTAKAASDKKES